MTQVLRAQKACKAPYPRTRNRVLVAPYTLLTEIVYSPSWAASTTTEYSWLIKGAYEVMNDIVTPCYDKLVSEGRIINNPRHSYRYELTVVPVNRYSSYAHTYGSPQKVDSYTRDWLNFCPPLEAQASYPVQALNRITPAEKANLQALATVKAYAKLDQTTWSLPVDLIELKATLKMLEGALNPFRTMVQSLRRLLKKLRNRPNRRRRRRPRRPIPPALLKKIRSALAQAGDAASGGTLEYLYGWLPLALSIEDAIDAFGRLEPEKVRQTMSHSEKLQRRDTQALPATTKPLGSGNGSLTTTKTADWLETYQSRVGVCGEMAVSWRHVFSLTPWHSPEIIWELITLSFIADWFAKIGAWLSGLRVQLEQDIVFSWVTNRSERELELNFESSGCSCLRTNSSTDHETYNENPYSSRTIESVKETTRTPNPPYPHSPPWSKDVWGIESLTHTCAGLALSYQALAQLSRR